MSTCCDVGNGFPTAQVMKDRTRDLPVIFAEICAIQQAILLASSNCNIGKGKYCTTIKGTSPMTILQNITAVQIVNGGTGYTNASPIAEVFRPDGSTGGASLTVNTNGGSIVSFTVLAGGTGYQPILAEATVSTITGSGAVITLTINQETGTITDAIVTNPGSLYANTDIIAITHPNGAGAILTPVFGMGGELLDINIVSGGSDYEDLLPYIEIHSSANPTVLHPTGTGLRYTIFTDIVGTITSVDVLDGGVGYVVLTPYTEIVDTTGSGALITLGQTAGIITSAVIVNSGYGYSQATQITAKNPETAPNPTVPAQLLLTIQPNAYGTDSAVYWSVASGAVNDPVIKDQLAQVVSYFTKLGYSIETVVNPDNGYTLMWSICWG